MHSTIPVIESAKASALAQFAVLTRQSREDASVGIFQSLSIAGGAERAALAGARVFLEEHGAILDKRLDVIFGKLLARAVQTMYSLQRPGLDHFSADSLKLIDDDTVNRDIEVDRLVVRLREADRENLGRVNLMVARLHDERDVRERENPFRPYLIARALHDAMHELVPQPAVRMLLFQRLADALCQHAPGYFLAIRRVFEASGIEARLTVVPSQFDLRRRDLMQDPMLTGNTIVAPSDAAGANPTPTTTAAIAGSVPTAASVPNAAPVSPGTRRLLTLLSRTLGPEGGADGLADTVRRMFGILPRAPAPGLAAPQARPSAELLSRLVQQQALGAAADTTSAAAAAARIALAGVSATRPENVLIGVVAVVFDAIEAERDMPAALRDAVIPLHAPFLKAVLLTPGLLQQPAHPARRLLNRLVSCAARRDPASAAGALLANEIGRVVRRILVEYDEDAATFAQCADEFDRFVADALPRAEPGARRCIEALECAVRREIVGTGSATLLASRLAALPVAPGVATFLTGVWPRVLAQAAFEDGIGGTACQAAADLVADLVWSAQPKLSPEERQDMLERLPRLVSDLRDGMQRIGMGEYEIERQATVLADGHTAALRGAPPNATPAHLEISGIPVRGALKQLFADLLPAATAMAPPTLRPDNAALRHALALPDLPVALHLDAGATTADAVPEFQLDAAVDCRGPDGWLPMRLLWTDRRRTLFLFGGEAGALELYDAPTLAEALSQQLLRPAEPLPVFDRAVHALVAGAGALEAASGANRA